MLFSSLFLPDRVRDAVSDAAWIQAMLDAEAALARAEAAVGVIPADAAEEIAGGCMAQRFDPEPIGAEGRVVGNPAEPLVRALRSHLSERAARYVHFGATSQDILDTASMLIARRALGSIDQDLAQLGDGLARLADEHRNTLMAGRTLLQQALPITFGFKAAQWLEGAGRARAALQRLDHEALAAELGGGAGTLAALGQSGPAVLREFARLLDLGEPPLPWHTERSRVAQIGAALSLAAGALDKIALDIILLAQTEVGEVSEAGEGGSSTMPQKHNPAGSILVRACARQAQANGDLLLQGMAQEHERAAGAWQAEWQVLSAALAFTGGAAARLNEVVAGLTVDITRMRANLDTSRGLVMAERVSILLSERIGRDDAHRLVRAASGRVGAGEGTLRDALLADDEVRRHLSVQEIEAAMDPSTYLGATQTFIDRALASYRERAGRRSEQ